jgi:hypothetical protein
MRTIPLIAFTMLITACVAHQPQTRITQFNEEEYKSYSGEGTAAIYGEAFLKTRGGDIKKGAGCQVHLNPVTSYSTEWYERQIVGGQVLVFGDQRAVPYHRETVADSNGAFEFDKLPPGEYYVACPIFWEVPVGIYATMVPTGGWAHARVKVGPGERKKVILTR